MNGANEGSYGSYLPTITSYGMSVCVYVCVSGVCMHVCACVCSCV